MRLSKLLERFLAPRSDDEFLYALVVEELEAGVQRKGLWAKAVVAAGSKEAAHHEYIRLRVEQLRPHADDLATKLARIAEIDRRLLDDLAEPETVLVVRELAKAEEAQASCREAYDRAASIRGPDAESEFAELLQATGVVDALRAKLEAADPRCVEREEVRRERERLGREVAQTLA